MLNVHDLTGANDRWIRIGGGFGSVLTISATIRLIESMTSMATYRQRPLVGRSGFNEESGKSSEILTWKFFLFSLI